MSLGLGNAIETTLVKIKTAGEGEHGAIRGAQCHERTGDFRNLRQSPRTDPLLLLRFLDGFEVNDVSRFDHVVGSFGNAAQGVFVDVSSAPRQSSPTDINDGTILGVNLGAFFLNLEHNTWHEIARKTVILEHVVETFFVRSAVTVPAIVFKQPVT